MGDWHKKFYDHVDECEQCRNSPFALCKTGEHYLKLAALGTLTTPTETPKEGE